MAQPKKLRSLVLDGSPRIVAGFKDTAADKTISELPQSGLDIAEMRIDLFSHLDPESVVQFVRKFSALPTIATIRIEPEGGAWALGEKERLALFRAVIPFVDAIDIELSAEEIRAEVIKEAHLARKLVLVSCHDFAKTPPLGSLNELVAEAEAAGADVVKIAASVHSQADVKTLARLLATREKNNLVVIGMGEDGLVTRLLFPALGSLMTHAYIDQPTGPGQLQLKTMLDTMRLIYRAFDEEKIATR